MLRRSFALSFLPTSRPFAHFFTWCVAPLALCVCTAVPAFAKDQVPDWVKQAAAQTVPAYPPRTDAVVLLDEHTYTVSPDGRAVEHVRRVVKVLRPQGRSYAHMEAWFSNASKLRSMHIWSIGADGHEYAPKDSELSEGSSWGGFELYSDDRARGGMPPAIDTGAVAAMEYEREERPYYNDIRWMPEEQIPVVKKQMLLVLPAGFNYSTSWKGAKKAQPADLEKGRTLWEAENLPALKYENVGLAPREESQAARMDVFYFGPAATPYPMIHGDWKEVGLWYEALAHDRNRPDAAITAKANEIVADKTDFQDRLQSIASYVQDQIRYVAIEVGVGGHQPHAAPDIFKARYGDCKDKATLLSAMLGAVGIRSTWVLVDSDRGVVDKFAPSVFGDHMIAAVEVPKGTILRNMPTTVVTRSGKQFLIFDPTWAMKSRLGDIESNLQGSDALLIDGEDSQPIRIPVEAPERSRIERTASYTLSPSGDLSGKNSEMRFGDSAADWRYYFAEVDQAKANKYVERFAAEDLSNFQLANIHVGNEADLSKPFTLNYDVTAPNYAQTAGPLLMVRPRVLGKESFGLGRTEHDKVRTVPIDLGSTREIHDRTEIEIPSGYTVDELPEPLHYESGFATYSSKVTAEGNKLKYDRTLTVREISLPPDRYADVEKLSQIINTDEQRTAVFKKN